MKLCNTGLRGRRRAPAFALTAVCIAALGSLGLHANAALDPFGPPPPADPSHFTPQPADARDASRALAELPPANEGALETRGGEILEIKEVGDENVIPQRAQTSFNYPTNGLPSPDFGAQPWTQKMFRFEELGTDPLVPGGAAGVLPLPLPTAGPPPQQDPEPARSSPDSRALDLFLRQPGLFPFPMRESNDVLQNPWRPEIELFLGRALVDPPIEGRPPGEGWAHQRWNEFFPNVFAKTLQAGARVNGGVRDPKQRHRYLVGEFGPGGLYHSTTGLPQNAGTTAGIPVRFHPNFPVQDHKSLWTFDGTFPPKLMIVRYGQPTLMRHYDALSIDPQANRGFGLHTITTHEHNGHQPGESDGFANAFFFPGQFYDYRWPIQLAGYDSINTTASDPRAAFPCAPGEVLFVNDAAPGPKPCVNGRINIRGDWRETMSSHWFHDHMTDFTAQNVYKGNAAMMNYYSALDRANEAVEDGVNLRLASGTALPWGNRDYDVNLLLADKAWDRQGQLWFNPFNPEGFIADRMTVNWQWMPVLDVRARRYRFRILNGSVSRYFSVGLVKECAGQGTCELPGPAGSDVSYRRIPFHLIANDGNIMEHAVPFDGSLDLNGDGDLQDHNALLPTQGIAERYDIIVDFARHGLAPGDTLYFVNTMFHDTGREAKERLSLADVLSGKRQAMLGVKGDGTPEWTGGDPVVGKFLQVAIKSPPPQPDLSLDPSAYEPSKPGKPAGRKMIPLWFDRDDAADRQRVADARHRTFDFGRSSGTDWAPWTIKADGGDAFNFDARRISAAPHLATGPTPAGVTGDATLEVWSLLSGGGWGHPVHVHFEEGVILSRDGKVPPEWEKWARKDVYRIGSDPETSTDVEFAIHFREFAGTYLEHCHNTQHEDTSMLLRWDVEYPGQFLVMPAPLPGWDGVRYAPSVGVPTFRTGDGIGPRDGVPTE